MGSVGIEVGTVVSSKAGRDRGQYYLVIRGIDDTTVLVADGVRRTVANPKKKNIKHLRIHSKPNTEISHKVLTRRKISDVEVREVLQVFVEKEGCE